MTYAFARKGLRCGQCQCFCFTPHARNQKRAVIEGYDHAGRKNKCGWKLKYKRFMCSSLCSANERIYIFWKCLIVSVNQGLKASYRLTTSFPGSLFSASLGRWKKDPGCGWSRAKLWHKLSHRGRVNQQFLSISTEAKERSFEIFQSCCKLHTGQMKYICKYLAYQPAAGRSVYCFAVSCCLNFNNLIKDTLFAK